MADTRPIVALAIGDPAGISPELAARMAADPTVRRAARLLVVGDRRVLERGAAVAGVALALDAAPEAERALELLAAGGPVLLDAADCDPGTVPTGEVSAAGGRSAAGNLRRALGLARDGRVAAVCYTPLNKAAMRRALGEYDDDIGFAAEVVGFDGAAREFNVLDGLWNARVTSHVPLSEVASLITREAVLENLALTDQALRSSGIDAPRIAVAGLNPHAGDSGSFGREEIDTIAPAVQLARARQIRCDGPFPADTVFLRARRGEFDAVLTMYHDQGQIAMKLIGFDAGVTLLGGFPFPICTAAHGTAFEIAGKGVADPGAMRNAVLLAARMAGDGPASGRQAAAQ